ncbi:hypothetical protein LBMAG12_18740 [Actinomycetes bacterium]|nr:hypothetical protein LBMAG12_18740 [Actinomycetes bacterium]
MVPAQSRDKGVITGFVVGLVLSFTAVAGLAVDSGRIVSARVSASDHAENAARVGAQEVTLLRLGWRFLDPVAAKIAAQQYLQRYGLVGDVTVGYRTVTVTVRMTQATTLLRLVGISSRTVSATRTAEIFDS